MIYAGTTNSKHCAITKDDSSSAHDKGIDLSTLFEPPEIDTVAVKEVLWVIDIITVIYFTLEYTVRFLCSPNKPKFFIKPMNLVDFFAILPYLISAFLESLQDLHILSKAGKVITHKMNID